MILQRIKQKDLTITQREILHRIKQLIGKRTIRYDFWFVSDYWEGGFELPLDHHFRNTYSLLWDGKQFKLYKNFSI